MTKEEVLASIARMETALTAIVTELDLLRTHEDETLMYTTPYSDSFREIDVFYVHLGISLGVFKEAVTKSWDNPDHEEAEE